MPAFAMLRRCGGTQRPNYLLRSFQISGCIAEAGQVVSSSPPSCKRSGFEGEILGERTNKFNSLMAADRQCCLSATGPTKWERYDAPPGMPQEALDLFQSSASLPLEPAPIEVLGGAPELDKQVAGQVLRLDLAALFVPQLNERFSSFPRTILASEPPL